MLGWGPKSKKRLSRPPARYTCNTKRFQRSLRTKRAPLATSSEKHERMGLLQHISTDDVRPSERPLLIEDALWSIFGRRGSNFTSWERPAVAKFDYGSIGDVRLCKLSGSGYGCEFTSAHGYDDCLEISIELQGTAYFTHAGRRLIQPAGQWTVLDASQPSAILAPHGSETLILTIPRNRLIGRFCTMDELILRPFSRSFGIGRIVCDFLFSFINELPKLGPRSELDIAETVCHLLRLAIIESLGTTTEHSHGELLRERIKTFILSDLRDSELSIDRIATVFHCTKRYLHKLFESEGTTVSEYIWQSRLDRCRNELLDGRFKDRSVTEIAFSWGFSSSAHFCTAFKQRFGIPPSRCRTEEKRSTASNRRVLQRSSNAQGRPVLVPQGASAILKT
jgi:AraC family transcriptional activator of tynA and feaB